MNVTDLFEMLRRVVNDLLSTCDLSKLPPPVTCTKLDADGEYR